jgi:signal transduction histidine kinase
VIFEVFREVRVLAEDHVKLTIKEIDQIAVCGDRDRLKQVLINLVSNGIKYTPAGGRVLVSLGRKDRYATVSIEDNGPGIPAEDLPHIFERFYRAEKARKRSKDGKGGYGLGLSIAYWIVHLHEGDITVDSVIGKGTTFTVKIPLLDGDCQGKEPLYAG